MNDISISTHIFPYFCLWICAFFCTISFPSCLILAPAGSPLLRTEPLAWWSSLQLLRLTRWNQKGFFFGAWIIWTQCRQKISSQKIPPLKRQSTMHAVLYYYIYKKLFFEARTIHSCPATSWGIILLSSSSFSSSSSIGTSSSFFVGVPACRLFILAGWSGGRRENSKKNI